MTDHDLEWLEAERPRPIVLDPATTERVRRQLLEHTAGAPRRRQAPRVRRRLRTLIRVGSLASICAAVAAVIAITASSHEADTTPRATAIHRTPVRRGSPAHARMPLLRLADYVNSGPAPGGDATLVLRTQTYPNQSMITGADLYTDSGEYFYSPTESGLPAQIAANDNVGDGFIARELAAAKLAANGDLQTAREEMAMASYAPGTTPSDLIANEAALRNSLTKLLRSATSPAQRSSISEKLDALSRADAQPPTLQSMETNPNMIWVNSLDAIVAGAGDPQVRAGILRILSTISQVQVANTTTDGQPSLTITATGEPATANDYQEQITINADTGVPILFTGGVPGQSPGVTVAYQVSRVTVSNVADGDFSAAG